MDYSSDNMLDLMSLINEAINLAKKVSGSDMQTNSCLKNLLNTKEKWVELMVLKNIKEGERELYFNQAKEDLKTDLVGFCMKR